MARRRRAEAAGEDPSAVILPLRLLVYEGHLSDEYRAFWQEQHQWLKDHGIDWRDWPSFSRVVHESKAAYGIANRMPPFVPGAAGSA
jgi:hypothetical protein